MRVLRKSTCSALKLAKAAGVTSITVYHLSKRLMDELQIDIADRETWP